MIEVLNSRCSLCCVYEEDDMLNVQGVYFHLKSCLGIILFLTMEMTLLIQIPQLIQQELLRCVPNELKQLLYFFVLIILIISLWNIALHNFEVFFLNIYSLIIEQWHITEIPISLSLLHNVGIFKYLYRWIDVNYIKEKLYFIANGYIFMY